MIYIDYHYPEIEMWPGFYASRNYMNTPAFSQYTANPIAPRVVLKDMDNTTQYIPRDYGIQHNHETASGQPPIRKQPASIPVVVSCSDFESTKGETGFWNSPSTVAYKG